MKLKKGDTIIVKSGKDRGRKGKVDKVYPKTQRVLVPGINMYKRHMKQRDSQHPGGVVDLSRPMDVSKIALVCPKCNQSTRIGYLVVKDEKSRICKKCEQII